MPTMEKFIQYADAVYDCLPIVSTITNGAQLLYKLAHTVDAVGNPVEKGFKTELKIHVLSKENAQMLWNMVPILGNLTSLLEFCVQDVKDNLMNAVINNNREVVRLRLANGYLQGDSDRTQKILRQAANCSNLETFQAVLDSKDDWTQEEILDCLQPHYQTASISALLNYWNAKWPDKEQLLPEFTKPFQACSTVSSIEELCNLGDITQEETIMKLIQQLPNVSFDLIRDLLHNETFNYNQYSWPDWKTRPPGYSLSSNALCALLEKCNRCSLHQLYSYAGHVNYHRTSLLIENNLEDADLQRIIREHDQIQLTVMTHLGNKLLHIDRPSHELATICIWDKVLLNTIYQFADKSSQLDKLAILQDCYVTTFSFWLDRLGEHLSDEQKKQLADSILQSEFSKAEHLHIKREIERGLNIAENEFSLTLSKSKILFNKFPELKPVEHQAPLTPRASFQTALH